MAQVNDWIFSINGDTPPGDAASAHPTKESAIAAAIATYWSAEDRQRIREQGAKNLLDPSAKNLRFFVGKVRPARLEQMTAGRLLDAIFEAQEGVTSDISPSWPEISDQQAQQLCTAVHKTIETALRQLNQYPNWLAVDYEKVEVPA